MCRASLGSRAPRHSTRHWGNHCRKCSLLHLLHFCCCSQWHYAQWPYWEKGPFTLLHFPWLVARQRVGSLPKVKRWMKMPFSFLFSFLFYMCCIVTSYHASLIAVHWQMPYSAFKYLFVSPSSLPPSTLSWHLFFPVQANWCFLLLGVECRASFQTFLQFFTQTVLSHDMKKFWTEFYQAAVYGKIPLFIFWFFFLIHFSVAIFFFFVFLIRPPKFQLNGPKLLEVVLSLALLAHLY